MLAWAIASLSPTRIAAIVAVVGLGILRVTPDSLTAVASALLLTLALGAAAAWFLLPGCDRSQMRAMIQSRGRK